jgi:hypothetical protein
MRQKGDRVLFTLYRASSSPRWCERISFFLDQRWAHLHTSLICVSNLSFLPTGSPRPCWLRTASFWPRWQALICTGRMSGFMGPDKPSSLVTTSSNHTSLLWGALLEGQWGSLGWRLGWASLGAKTASQEQGPNFDLVGTSYIVVISEILRVVYTVRWSGSSPAGCILIRIATTLLDMSDRLSLLSSHSMSGVLLMVRGWVWLWLQLCYHDDYYISLLMTLTFYQRSACLCML